MFWKILKLFNRSEAHYHNSYTLNYKLFNIIPQIYLASARTKKF